jgi:hypothetical protein
LELQKEMEAAGVDTHGSMQEMLEMAGPLFGKPGDEEQE